MSFVFEGSKDDNEEYSEKKEKHVNREGLLMKKNHIILCSNLFLALVKLNWRHHYLAEELRTFYSAENLHRTTSSLHNS